MKDYKIKENLCNMKQSIDHLKEKMSDLDAKFQILVDILTEKEKEDGEKEESEKS